MDYNEQQERNRDRELQRERAGLDLVEAKQGAQDRSDRRALYDNLTTDLAKTRDEDGNLVSTRVPRQLDDEGKRGVWSRLAEFDASRGIVRPEQALSFQNALRQADREGVWDTLAALESGDTDTAKKAFDRGRYRLAPGSEPMAVEMKDEYGTPYRAWKARLVDSETGQDVGVKSLDPRILTYAQTGARGFTERQKLGLEAQKVGAEARKDAAQAGLLGAQEEFYRGARTDLTRAQAERQSAAAGGGGQPPAAVRVRENRITDLMGLGMSREEAIARIERDGTLSLAQQTRNAEINAARKVIGNLPPEEIKRRTAKFTNTGRENPDFDPTLTARVRLANSRKHGDDAQFDTAAEREPLPKEPAASRFAADGTMRGNRLGRVVPGKGREVIDQSGKLIGYWN
ncbi:MAG: hypothetical protein EPO20_15110 [Betaproteobacteria bacterium]|nr:MAG: hypothetical protein EPO20_15110 [Betaproteobacteria bacterium]